MLKEWAIGDGGGDGASLTLKEERELTKRANAISISKDGHIVLVADKFGDVYTCVGTGQRRVALLTWLFLTLKSGARVCASAPADLPCTAATQSYPLPRSHTSRPRKKHLPKLLLHQLRLPATEKQAAQTGPTELQQARQPAIRHQPRRASGKNRFGMTIGEQ